MKKYLAIFIFFLISSCSLNAQIMFEPTGEFGKETVLNNVANSVNKSDCIVEGSYISKSTYFIEKENQSYVLYLVCVKESLKGLGVHANDTIGIVWKKEFKGLDDDDLISHSRMPKIWGGSNFIACLFLQHSDYPQSKDTPAIAKYVKFKLVKTDIGYLCARYIDIHFSSSTEAVYLNGLSFKTIQDWYDYLKQFPNIKVPTDK